VKLHHSTILLFSAVVTALLQGCQQLRPSEKIQREELLERNLSASENKAEGMGLRNKDLFLELKLLQARVETLEKEKALRVEEIRRLRSGVRKFTESVRDSFERYRPEIKDYFGGELCERKHVETSEGVILIDRQNRPEGGSIITGARALVKGPGRYVFCLLRPIHRNEHRVMTVATSQILETKDVGQQEWTFFEPMTVQPGDYIGLYTYGSANIVYDAAGTGDVIALPCKDRPKIKYSTFPIESHRGPDSRAYSFGAIGYMRLFEE